MSKIRKKIRKQDEADTISLLGIEDILADSLLTTDGGELVYFLVKPSNLSVLSAASVAARVKALMFVLSTVADAELLCLNSRADFENNKNYYNSRMARETNPAIRQLLNDDLKYLDSIQTSMATAREFLIVLRLSRQSEGERESYLIQMEQRIQEQGFFAKRADKEDIKRLLAVYFQQNVASERLDDFDGQRWVIGWEGQEERI